MEPQNSSSCTPPLCARGCGFYGTAENRNMCSKCYNDYLKQELIDKKAASICASVSSDKKIDTTNQSVPTCIDGERGSSATKIAPCSSSSSSSSSSPTVKNRCRSCNKKVGLTGFACRCGKVFCGMHRYSDEHRCTFDYKEFDRQILVKHNPVIRGDKLDDRV